MDHILVRTWQKSSLPYLRNFRFAPKLLISQGIMLGTTGLSVIICMPKLLRAIYNKDDQFCIKLLMWFM